MAVSWEDKEKIIAVINQLSRKIPPFMKAGLSKASIAQFFSMLPPEFKRYTLGELIDTVGEAWNEKKITW